MKMFVIEGSIIGILGGIAGVFLGFVLSWGINLLGGIYIPPPPGRSSGVHSCRQG
jgi:putative ABC transport system permease protein